MSLETFQILCLPVLLVAYAVLLRTARHPRRRLVELAALAVAAWLGEHTVIAAYQMYAYADEWWPRVGHVPLLVALIWPIVIISARDVVGALWPHAPPLNRALTVGAFVVLDASLIEVIAVAAGFWRWTEPVYLGVPLIGIVGWGCFAAAATVCAEHRWFEGRRVALAPAAIVAATHLSLLALWWGGFRWVLRAPLGASGLVIWLVASVALTLAIVRARRGPNAVPHLPGRVAGPRIVAASLFVALLAVTPSAAATWLWAHLGVIALPYWLASLPTPLIASRYRQG